MSTCKITLELHGNWGPSQWGGGAWLYLPSRMLRVWASLDTSYGSHWGFWRTRYYELQGINWRGGKRPGPALTVLAHTRRISSGPVEIIS